MSEWATGPIERGDFWVGVMWLQITLFCAASQVTRAIERAAVGSVGLTELARRRRKDETT